MRAWEVRRPLPIDEGPLEFVERPLPEPGPGQVRVRISVCGVCRTDLHVSEGDLPVHRSRVVPGHEVVGRVDITGPGADRFVPGDRVGIAWLASTCGTCRFCRRGQENLCLRATFTGWDHDGGYSEATVVDERYAYRLPDELPDDQAAPLLCAGIIGYRALRAHGPSPRRPSRCVRVRRFGAHHGPDRPGRGGQPLRGHPVGRRPAPGRASGGELGGRCRRAPSRPARCRHLLRPGGRPGPRGARGARSGCDPGDRRHPPERHPATALRRPALRRAQASLGDGQHARKTARSSWRSPPVSGSRRSPPNTPWTGPIVPWPTSPTTG